MKYIQFSIAALSLISTSYANDADDITAMTNRMQAHIQEKNESERRLVETNRQSGEKLLSDYKRKVEELNELIRVQEKIVQITNKALSSMGSVMRSVSLNTFYLERKWKSIEELKSWEKSLKKDAADIVVVTKDLYSKLERSALSYEDELKSLSAKRDDYLEMINSINGAAAGDADGAAAGSPVGEDRASQDQILRRNTDGSIHAVGPNGIRRTTYGVNLERQRLQRLKEEEEERQRQLYWSRSQYQRR